MNKLIKFLKTIAYVLVTILSICLVAMTMLVVFAAQASEPTEPTALEREQARIQWIAEHGQYQPNPTEQAKQEAMAYTNIKQKELDYEKGKNRN